jgi:hypothetical protein
MSTLTAYKYILFAFDPFVVTQVLVASATDEDDLIAVVEGDTTSTHYYSIYKYNSVVFAFGGTQKGRKWSRVRVLKGKKNSGDFLYAPPDYAIQFENEDAWFYQTA